MSLPVADLVGELKSLANAYEMATFPAAGFNELSLSVAGSALEVTGVAVPEPAPAGLGRFTLSEAALRRTVRWLLLNAGRANRLEEMENIGELMGLVI